MPVFCRSKFTFKPILIPLLTLVALLSISSASHAYLNRSYTSLEQAKVFKGDFNGILRSGKLRILVPRDFTSVSYLPRQRSPLADQQRIIEEFALSHGLMPELVIVDNFAKLIPALEAGKGDVIINNLTVNDQRLKKIAFSVPVDYVFEQVIVASNDKSIRRVRDLNGKTVMVNAGSTFWHALKWLKENKYPDIELLTAPDRLQREGILDLLANGEIDATIMDSNLVEIYESYRDDFRVATNFSGQRNIAWGVRKNAPKLLSQINRYLQLEYRVEDHGNRYQGDFISIKERRVIRVMLRNNASSYFLYRGELMGFEYELAREFANFHGLRLEVVVPPSNRELSTWLLEGRADFAMGFLEIDESQRRLGIAYSEPYHYARQHIVVSKNDKADSLADLAHRTVIVRHHSNYWDRLSQLQREGAGFTLRAANDAIETEQLIQMVSRGKYKATMADEHLLDIELAKSVAVRSAYATEYEVPHVIALRKRNPQLKRALDAFVKRVYKSEFYNITYRKYFKSKRSVIRLAKGRVVDTLSGEISPYDSLVRKYAERYGFDWRLVTAQMYQESGFDPKAKSPSGAKGLMQMMPRTAKSMGVSKIADPAQSIKGGVKYMSWLRDRFSTDIPMAERQLFTLAAYNAGAGHVHDARRLAEQMGHDPNRWFDHTESAMLLLSKKKYSKKARYGFVNGAEPVKYVREITDRFEAYISLSGTQISSPPGKALLALAE